MLKLFTTLCEQLWEENHDKTRRLNVVGEYPHKLYMLKEAEEQFKCLSLHRGITNKESVEGQALIGEAVAQIQTMRELTCRTRNQPWARPAEIVSHNCHTNLCK